MQRFKNYFAEPPKKKKFRKRKIILTPLESNHKNKENSSEIIKIEEKSSEKIEEKNPKKEEKEGIVEENLLKNQEKIQENSNEIKEKSSENQENPIENIGKEEEKKEEIHQESKEITEKIPENAEKNLENDIESIVEKESKNKQKEDIGNEESVAKSSSESHINSAYGTLIISPKNAELLSKSTLSSEMQTLVRIKLWEQTLRTKTSKYKGKTPIWTQVLSFERHFQAKNRDFAIVEIWQNDDWKTNELFGSAVLNILDIGVFGESKKTSKWIDLFSESKEKVGRILVAFEWKPIEKKPMGRFIEEHKEEKIKESKEKIEKGVLNKKMIMNSKKTGLLILKPKQCHLNPPNSLPSDMDAYIKVFIGKEPPLISSESLSKGGDLKWVQSLNIKRKASDNEISLELWFKDNFSGNELRGKATLDLLKMGIFLENKTELWLDLIGEDDKVEGKLALGIQWKPIEVKKNENY